MTIRTFKQKGQAYGSSTASIVATVDGVVVYSGTVNTLDQSMPSFPDLENSYGVDLFTWQEDVTFSGTQTLSISVTGSDLLLTDSVANYITIEDPANPGNYISGGADLYGQFFNETVDGVVYSDPFTNEEIDGVAQSGPPDASLPGQWYWKIPAGSTFTATINVQAGLE